MPKTRLGKRTLAPLLVLSGLILASPTLAAAAAPASVLGTPGQIAAEKLAIALLDDPEIKAIQAQVRAELAATPLGQTPEGAAGLDRNIGQWTTSFLIGEVAADPLKPQILWHVDNTEHSWEGRSIEGMAVAGDNPDHIYRGTTLDGDGRYEILGQVDTRHRPAQFSFEVTRKGQALRQTASNPDMGSQVHLLTDRDIQVAPDGSFRLTVGGPGTEPNHLRTVPGPIGIGFRDVLSDWSQRPNRLTIRRLDTANATARDEAGLRRDIVAGLAGHIRFWGQFKDKWFGGLKPNAPVGPVQRDGNWGYLAAARYVLAPDEAVVITTTRGGARYTGIQATDGWMIAPDGKKHQTSVNLSQAKPGPDGGFTYVVSPRDPGVANWVDTGGIHDGYILLRWQGFDPGSTSDGLLRGYRVVKIAELKALLGSTTAWVTPEQRREALAQRATAYHNRQN